MASAGGLPSIAIISGVSSRSSPTQAKKHVLNTAGSMAAIISHNVSWLGMPRAKGRKRRRNASRSHPQVDLDEIIGPGNRPTNYQQQNFCQWIQMLSQR
jgi:hypothetical protein